MENAMGQIFQCLQQLNDVEKTRGESVAITDENRRSFLRCLKTVR